MSKLYIVFALFALVAFSNAAGSWKTVQNIKTPQIENLVQFGVQNMMMEGGILAGGSFAYSKTISVQTQLVNGMNYRITAQFTKTLSSGSTSTENVMFTIYQPISGTAQFVNAKILLQDNFIGSWTPVTNFNTPQFQNMVNVGLTEMSKPHGILSSAKYYLYQIVSVQEQTVNGMKYQVVAKFSTTQVSPLSEIVPKTTTVLMSFYVAPGKQAVLTEAQPANSNVFSSVGGFEEEEFSQDSADELVESVMPSMTLYGGVLANGTWSLNKVLKVKKQVVNGLNYIIVAQFVNAEGQTRNVLMNLYAAPGQQPALTSSKVLLQGGYFPEPEEESGSIIGSTAPVEEEESTEESTPVGSFTDDEDSEEVSKLAYFGLEQMQLPGGQLQQGLWSVSKVLSAQKQIVNGLLYKLCVEVTDSVSGKCENVLLTIYVAPGQHPVLLKSQVLLLAPNPTPSNSNNLQATGGQYTTSTDSEDAEALAIFGLVQMQAPGGVLDDSEGVWTLQSVLRVETQIVNGMNYRIVATVENANGRTENVMMVIYVPINGTPSLTSAKVLFMTGNSNTVTPTISGGWTTSNDAEDAEILAIFGLEQMQMPGGVLADSESVWTLQSILRVQTQLVSGMNYRIVATIIDNTGRTENVMMTIYVPINGNPSLTSAKVLFLASNPTANSNSAPIASWATTDDTEDAEALADFGLLQMQMPGGVLADTESVWTLSSIIRVQKQLVNGMNYRIVAQVIDNTGRTENVLMQVYVDLNGNPTLTSAKVLLLTKQTVAPTKQQVGGWTVDQEEEGADELAMWGLEQMQLPGGILNGDDWTLQTVLRVESQVTNGITYRIVATVENSKGMSENVLMTIYQAPNESEMPSLTDAKVLYQGFLSL